MFDLICEMEKRQEDEASCELLFELEADFDEFVAAHNEELSSAVLNLYYGLKLVVDDDFSVLLREHRRVVVGARNFAVEHQLCEIAHLLSDALEGKPQEDVSISIRVADGPLVTAKIDSSGMRCYKVCEGTTGLADELEECVYSKPEDDDVGMFEGKYWGGMDVTLSMELEPFEEALLAAIIKAKNEFVV